MKINKLNLPIYGDIEDFFILQPESFEDFRGENFEGYSEERYSEIFSTSKNWSEGKNKFITDSFSKSRKDVLRGFHGDSICWKLIECLKGSIYFSVVDTRPHSRTFGNHICLPLTEHNRYQVLVPSGCVNAHLCLSDECLFHYKLTGGYVPQQAQIHVKWNDPEYGVYWPIKTPILSQRDQ